MMVEEPGKRAWQKSLAEEEEKEEEEYETSRI
jgi:hypothetical protein